MVKSVNTIACIGCRLCENVCPGDVFRLVDGKMTIVYHGDCCNCLQCRYVCPVDALSFTRGEPKKLNMSGEWETIKKLMGAVDHPMAAETRMPPWEKAKRKAAAGTPAG